MKTGAVLKFIRENAINFVIIGPEDPLAAGLADEIRDLKVPVFGPSKEGARLEADKWFAKELMRHQAIPTAEGRSFTDPVAAEEYVKTRDDGCVVKAAGLAKGKGVAVCYRTADALEAINQSMRNKVHGAAATASLSKNSSKVPRSPSSPSSTAARSMSWKPARTTKPSKTATPAR